MVAAVTKQLNKNRSMDKKVTLAQLKEVVQEAYDQVKTNTGGKNADYIPYLANVNKDLFGISVCLLNGQTIHVGDTDYRFGIESVSKVHTAILALRQYGAKEILDKIGADATGLPFNSIRPLYPPMFIRSYCITAFCCCRDNCQWWCEPSD